MSHATAVVVIDVQNGLFAEPEPVYQGPAVVARIREVLERARRAGVPVVFVQDNDVGPLDSPAWQLHPALEPRPGDLFIRKPSADSFYRTDLHSTLQERGIGHLIVAGCKTDVCVDATSRRAVSLGYDVTLVADAHTTTDNRFLAARQSIEYYNILLDGIGLEDGFGNGEHSITVLPASQLQL